MRSVLSNRFAENERGAAAVELAIIAPLLVILLLNTVDFSRMIWDYMETIYSSRMGAWAAYQTCAGGMLPATTNCSGLDAVVTTGIQGTSLGTGVTLASGSPSEGYYCLSGTTLQWVGDYNSRPNPFNCSSIGEPNVTPGDYIHVGVNYSYTPVFPGLSLLSAFTMNSGALQRL